MKAKSGRLVAETGGCSDEELELAAALGGAGIASSEACRRASSGWFFQVIFGTSEHDDTAIQGSP